LERFSARPETAPFLKMGVTLGPVEGRWKIRCGSLAAECLLAVMCGFSVLSAGAQSASSDGTARQQAANPAATKAKSNPASAGKAHTSTRTAAQSVSASASQSRSAKAASARASTSKGRKKKTARGQQKIDAERAQAIQQALIREHYLSADAAGSWNQASEDAMRKYQADHGWQSKTVPDSRALISLGLGPSHDHLLNPESAMTTGPDTSHAGSVSSSTQSPVSHSADPGARIDTKSAAPAAAPGHDSAGPQ
jgi:hypothetical protein